MTARRGTVPGRRWKNVDLVRERDDRRVRRLWSWLLGVVAAFAPTAWYLLQQMEYVQVAYRIEELRDQQERLSETERRLTVERATLEALSRVESRAARELGLVHPAPEQVVVVGDRSLERGGLMALGEAPGQDPSAR